MTVLDDLVAEFSNVTWHGLQGIGTSWYLIFGAITPEKGTGSMRISTDSQAFMLDRENNPILINSSGSLHAKTWDDLREEWLRCESTLDGLSLDEHGNFVLSLSSGVRLYLPHLGRVTDVAMMFSAPGFRVTLTPGEFRGSRNNLAENLTGPKVTNFALLPTLPNEPACLARLRNTRLRSIELRDGWLKVRFKAPPDNLVSELHVAPTTYWALYRRRTLIGCSGMATLECDESPRFWEAIRDGLIVREVVSDISVLASVRLGRGYKLLLFPAPGNEQPWQVM